MIKIREFANPLILFTIFAEVILLGYRFWAGLSSLSANYTDVTPLDFLGNLLLALLLLVNVGMAIARAKQRVAHLTASLTIVVTLVLLAAMLRNQYVENRQWFIQSGLRNYQYIVEKISQNKTKLTGDMSPLDDLIGASSLPLGTKVRGATNEDGSLTIQFIGRGKDSRTGYLYYSGTELKPKHGHSNPCFFPGREDFAHWLLTNNWYEY